MSLHCIADQAESRRLPHGTYWLFLRHGAPVISTDTKNSVLIGNFKTAGARWCRQTDEVFAHDFLGDAECRAVPYGVYDVGRNRGQRCACHSGRRLD
jgi:hypothetical protein